MAKLGSAGLESAGRFGLQLYRTARVSDGRVQRARCKNTPSRAPRPKSWGDLVCYSHASPKKSVAARKACALSCLRRAACLRCACEKPWLALVKRGRPP